MQEDNVRLVWYIKDPSARFWSVNPYKACGFGCAYCIARSWGKVDPWCGPDRVTDELRTRISEVPLDVEVSVGALADPYPPEEEQLGVTRLVLKELSRQSRSFCVNTKSPLVQRDIDILLQHDGHCDVFVSLCCLDQGIISKLEINAPSVADRLQAVSALDEAGVDVNIDVSPWIRGVTDIPALLDATPARVGIQVGSLDIRHIGAVATLGGMRFTQEQINEAYCQYIDMIGEHPRVRWKDDPR